MGILVKKGMKKKYKEYMDNVTETIVKMLEIKYFLEKNNASKEYIDAVQLDMQVMTYMNICIISIFEMEKLITQKNKLGNIMEKIHEEVQNIMQSKKTSNEL